MTITTTTDLEEQHRRREERMKTPLKSNTIWTKAQVGENRRNRARWDAYVTGTAYRLYLNPLTYKRRPYKVVAHGNTPAEAIKRYYAGLDGGTNPKELLCRECIAVYALPNPMLPWEEGEKLWGSEGEGSSGMERKHRSATQTTT